MNRTQQISIIHYQSSRRPRWLDRLSLYQVPTKINFACSILTECAYTLSVCQVAIRLFPKVVKCTTPRGRGSRGPRIGISIRCSSFLVAVKVVIIDTLQKVSTSAQKLLKGWTYRIDYDWRGRAMAVMVRFHPEDQ